jgi:tRNA threonylcarbamoyladenosine biosynthesis protein TsaB
VIRVAIETATSMGSVAVGEGDGAGARVLAEVSLGAQRRHAEMVVPALDAALRLAGVDRRSIGAVVVGAGPGSFTGVRVAGATAKGLVAALGVPLLAYPSPLALVAGVPSDGPVCGLLDARRGEVYGGCWRVTASTLETVVPARVGPVESLIEAVGDGPLYVGDGAARYADALAAAGAAGAAGVPAWPRASTLLWLAAHHGGAGVVDDAAAWQPEYVRASSAERGVAG